METKTMSSNQNYDVLPIISFQLTNKLVHKETTFETNVHLLFVNILTWTTVEST